MALRNFICHVTMDTYIAPHVITYLFHVLFQNQATLCGERRHPVDDFDYYLFSRNLANKSVYFKHICRYDDRQKEHVYDFVYLVHVCGDVSAYVLRAYTCFCVHIRGVRLHVCVRACVRMSTIVSLTDSCFTMSSFARVKAVHLHQQPPSPLLLFRPLYLLMFCRQTSSAFSLRHPLESERERLPPSLILSAWSWP